ncbi:hypothetical protein MELE44368_14185 [Mycolicibacterium elephantis DSM 44368]|uniref:Uncharacterized protein n=1 Tax=Mycolicibacterium elephantis DSM 44368 TaxID=1335622 RepID=A0A439DXS3_9MYCO|nr:hypothetical protein MELE44368_14185 [Mycolicibacterium elephantis DSM 44368]
MLRVGRHADQVTRGFTTAQTDIWAHFTPFSRPKVHLGVRFDGLRA